MTKIDIISGFLGAGKTTLIKKLLDEAFQGEKLVLIENEFGEIGIDGGFLKDAGVQITEMNSGCICCSLVGDFGAALKQVLADYAPDRIVIEPSGVGKLSDVIAAVERVQADTPDLHLNSFVTVVDATKAKVYMKNFGEFFNNQVEHACAIVLSRTQKLDEAKLNGAVHLLREKNPKAAILTTPWDQLTGKQILAAMEGGHDLAHELMEEIEHEHHDHGADCDCGCHDHHHHEHEHCGHEHHHDHEHCDHDHCGHDHHHDHGDTCTACHEGHHHHGHDADEVFTSWGRETPPEVQPGGAPGGPGLPGHGGGLRLHPPGQGDGPLRRRTDLAPLRPGARGVPDPGGRGRLHRPAVRHRRRAEGGQAGGAVRPVSSFLERKEPKEL